MHELSAPPVKRRRHHCPLPLHDLPPEQVVVDVGNTVVKSLEKLLEKRVLGHGLHDVGVDLAAPDQVPQLLLVRGD